MFGGGGGALIQRCGVERKERPCQLKEHCSVQRAREPAQHVLTQATRRALPVEMDHAQEAQVHVIRHHRVEFPPSVRGVFFAPLTDGGQRAVRFLLEGSSAVSLALLLRVLSEKVWGYLG